jgi:hypothetical protein
LERGIYYFLSKNNTSKLESKLRKQGGSHVITVPAPYPQEIKKDWNTVICQFNKIRRPDNDKLLALIIGGESLEEPIKVQRSERHTVVDGKTVLKEEIIVATLTFNGGKIR